MFYKVSDQIHQSNMAVVWHADKFRYPAKRGGGRGRRGGGRGGREGGREEEEEKDEEIIEKLVISKLT